MFHYIYLLLCYIYIYYRLWMLISINIHHLLIGSSSSYILIHFHRLWNNKYISFSFFLFIFFFLFVISADFRRNLFVWDENSKYGSHSTKSSGKNCVGKTAMKTNLCLYFAWTMTLTMAMDIYGRYVWRHLNVILSMF